MGLWDFISKMAEGDRTKRHIFGLINFIQNMKKTCFTFALKYEEIFPQSNISIQIFKYCIKYTYFYTHTYIPTYIYQHKRFLLFFNLFLFFIYFIF